MTLLLTLLALLAALAWTTLAGWSLARLFTAGLSREETAAWSFAVGLLLHVALYVSLLAARAIPGPRNLLAAEAVVLAASLAAKRPRHAADRGQSRRTPATAVLLALLAAGALGLFAVDVLGSPIDATDFLAIWGWKARTIFFSGSIPLRLFHDPFTFWSHPEYPLFVPLCLASFAAVLRRFDAHALMILYPAFEAATLLALFGFLRRKGSPVAGGVAALVAAACFPLYRAANAGTAEVPMALGFVLAAIAALDLAEGNSSAARLRALVASVLCVTIKQEGSLFVALLALWLVGREIRSRRVWHASWLSFALPPLVQAAALRILRGPVAPRDFDLTLLTPRRLPEWLGRWREVLVHLARVEIPAAALPLMGLVLFLVLSRRRGEDPVLVVLAVQTGAYAAAASLSAFGPVWGLESAFARTTLALVPALALVLGGRAASLARAASSHP